MHTTVTTMQVSASPTLGDPLPARSATGAALLEGPGRPGRKPGKSPVTTGLSGRRRALWSSEKRVDPSSRPGGDATSGLGRGSRPVKTPGNCPSPDRPQLWDSASLQKAAPKRASVLACSVLAVGRFGSPRRSPPRFRVHEPPVASPPDPRRIGILLRPSWRMEQQSGARGRSGDEAKPTRGAVGDNPRARIWANPQVGGRRRRSAADCCFQRRCCNRADTASDLAVLGVRGQEQRGSTAEQCYLWRTREAADHR